MNPGPQAELFAPRPADRTVSVSTDWLPYQRRFLRAAGDPRYRIVALSMPRGGGKTTLAGHLVARALTPGDPLYVAGGEVVLFAGSIEQCRLTYRQTLAYLGRSLGEYRLTDASNRVAITRTACRTRLKAVGSNPKTSLGLVGVPLVIVDEPAALHTVGGQALWDSVRTAAGKVGSPLRIVLTGTIAPAEPGTWWPLLVERGTQGSTWVECIQGRSDRWSTWREVLRCNPLAKHHREMAVVLREELDAAKSDTRLAGAFKSFRLNLPAGDESTMLLSESDIDLVLGRPAPERIGRPVVGIDLGGGRAWSAAVAVWRNGRVEAVALAPGVPGIEKQERRDQVPFGTYRRLLDSGALTVAEGVRVQPPATLWRTVRTAWGRPAAVFADRYREHELRDVVAGACPLIPRVSGWKDSSEDIRALRRMVADGPLAVAPESRHLLDASLTVAAVKTDDAGNVRMRKSPANVARDDVAQAFVLAAGALARAPAPRRVRSGIAG